MNLKSILKLFGKDYTPDPDLPKKLIIRTLLIRFIYLLVGLIKFKKSVFISPSANIINKKNLRLGKNSSIEDNVYIDCFASQECVIGKGTKIGSYSKISSTSHFTKLGKGFKIGDGCGISEFSYFGSAGGITIGDNVIMGQYVSFHSQNHSFDIKKNFKEQNVISKGIKIGSNVWIGAKVTILDGVIINDNSVIGAGSLVNNSFPSNILIAGVPARIIKKLDE